MHDPKMTRLFRLVGDKRSHVIAYYSLEDHKKHVGADFAPYFTETAFEKASTIKNFKGQIRFRWEPKPGFSLYAILCSTYILMEDETGRYKFLRSDYICPEIPAWWWLNWVESLSPSHIASMIQTYAYDGKAEDYDDFKLDEAIAILANEVPSEAF
jgi:hypothetical protein